MAIRRISTDVCIIGSGPGGATLAYALRESGADVTLLERGGHIPHEPENQSVDAVFLEQRYKAHDTWLDGTGRTFKPGNHYAVGGNSKVFGACLGRMRESDFAEYRLQDGISPAWPISYAELEPFYAQAERIYRVHGNAGEDHLDPPRSAPYPSAAVPHDPVIARLAERLRAQGLRPFSLPMGLDYGAGGRCVLSRECDAFVCPLDAKSDAEVCCVRPALEHANVRLITGAYAERLHTDAGGARVSHLDLRIDGEPASLHADQFIVSAGAVNSAALLLRSANSQHPDGLANGSGQVGRNYLAHMNAALIAVDPRSRSVARFQKTLGINDFYGGDGSWPYPLGSMQLVGKVQADMIRAQAPRVPVRLAAALAERSVDWWLFTEDAPLAENRVTLAAGGRIRVQWRPTNRGSQRRLIRHASRMMRRAGYPLVISKRFGLATNSHQAGTLRFGSDAATSVLDPLCRSHEIPNLWAVDASFFPSIGAGPGGPTLTIAAQALRVAPAVLAAMGDARRQQGAP